MAPQDDLTAERAAKLYNSLNAYISTDRCVHTDEFNQVEVEKVEDIAKLTAALKTARQEALREAAKQTCMYCSGNARGYTLGVAGPNLAGNYTHEVPEDSWAKECVLCKATSIWSLIYYEDRLASEGG